MSVRCSWTRQAVVAACALACSSVSFSQSTWYVDASADLGGDGSASFPFTTIQLGINAADLVSGDLILVAPGTYSQRIDYQGKNIRVDRWGPDGEVVIEPATPGEVGSVVRIDGTDWGRSQGLANVVVQGGWSSGWGGGLYVRDASPLIQDCVFRDNHARNGGGGAAALGTGSALFERCRFERNSVSQSMAPVHLGGGLVGRNTTVRDSVFEDNQAKEGGGAAAAAGPVVCERCIFRGNEASYGGGAVDIQATHCVFEDNVAIWEGGGAWSSDLESCILSGNTATTGGGVAGCDVVSCSLLGNSAVGSSQSLGTGGGAWGSNLIDCLVVGNSADEGGGASGNNATGTLFVANTARYRGAAVAAALVTRSRIVGHVTHSSVVASGSLTHCVAWGNDASQGGALLSMTTIHNCIVRGNQGPLMTGHLFAYFSNVEGGYPGEGNIDAPALFWSPNGGPDGEERDFRLMPGSPCIDAGNPGFPLDPDGSRADMGVYPFDPEWFHAIAYCEAGTTTNGCRGTLSWTGVPSATTGSGFELVAAGIEGQTTGLLFYGTDGPDSSMPWPSSSSLLCVVTPAQRMTLQGTSGTAGSCDGELREDFNLYIATHPAANGIPFAAGDTVWAQGWFRDLSSPAGHHLTNGLQFTVGP